MGGVRSLLPVPISGLRPDPHSFSAREALDQTVAAHTSSSEPVVLGASPKKCDSLAFHYVPALFIILPAPKSSLPQLSFPVSVSPWES